MARPGSLAPCVPPADRCGTSRPPSRELEGREATSSASATIAAEFNARRRRSPPSPAALDGVQGKSLCLLVDQFEELFRYEKELSRDEAELFIDLIERAAAEQEDETATGRSTSQSSSPCARNSSANAPALPASPRPSTGRNISFRAWTTRG